jgi:hypothetical protein
LASYNEEDISGFVCAIGDIYIREKAFYECSEARLIPVNAISSKAIISPDEFKIVEALLQTKNTKAL